jgi:hypothetical protein
LNELQIENSAATLDNSGASSAEVLAAIEFLPSSYVKQAAVVAFLSKKYPRLTTDRQQVQLAKPTVESELREELRSSP